MPHKLLLADDSVTIQRVIELTFADEDVQVIAVGDGKQAIERVQTERPDIVLADIGMPERDGYEVAAFIKETPGLSHIPVLLLTGAFEPIDEGRARAVGCDGVLVKPFEPQMVISRVKDLIAGRRSAPPAFGSAPVAPRPEPPADTMRAAAAGARPPLDQPNRSSPGPSGSIEDYFDRLDAAFASLDTPAPAPREEVMLPPPEVSRDVEPSGGLALADELASWDPDLGGASGAFTTPRETEPAGPPQPSPADFTVLPEVPSRAPAAQTAPLSSPAAASPVPSLAEAFAALLAAEQGRPFDAASAGQAAPGEDIVEQVTRRVIERLGDGAVRDVVLDVAERLVREEIARLKADAR